MQLRCSCEKLCIKAVTLRVVQLWPPRARGGGLADQAVPVVPEICHVSGKQSMSCVGLLVSPLPNISITTTQKFAGELR